MEHTSLRRMAHACIEAIAKTLITEQRHIDLPDFLLDLHQRKLIDSTSRFVRVVAPAGSGKTRSLIAKAVQLLRNVPNANILCLTFTNAAANEFKERAKAPGLATATAGRMHVSTVNSFGYQIVKQLSPNHQLVTPDARSIGGAYALIKERLKISPLGATDQHRTMYRQILELSDLTKGLGFWHDNSVEEAMSRYLTLKELRVSPILDAKMQELHLWSPEQVLFKSSPGQVFIDAWFPFWQNLAASLWEARYLTLEDQKYWAAYLLDKNNKCQAWLQNQAISHVMVDEFQDINYLDLHLIGFVAYLSKASLFVVGDDDQCIYEWRGCTSHFIRCPDKHLAFVADEGTAASFDTILFERNYRCPRNIVSHATKLIAHNRERVTKNIEPVRLDDANIRVVPLPAAYMTMHVVDELVASISHKHPEHTIAVLGRKKCQLLPMQLLFTRRRLRFHIDKDLNVFLGAAFQAFREIMTLPPGYSTRTGSAQASLSLLTVLDRLKKEPINKEERAAILKYLADRDPHSLAEAVHYFREYPGQLKRGYVRPREAADQLKRFLECSSVVQSLFVASESFKGFAKDFVRAKEDIFYSDPPFSHLADLAVDYDSDFARFIADIDKTMQEAEFHSIGGPKIELMTALRAKGREFDTVIMLDVNDGIWPNALSVKEGRIEEERRLFYVSVSRTKQNLLLFESGRVNGKALSPSPFIHELDLPSSVYIKDPEVDRLSGELLSTLRV